MSASSSTDDDKQFVPEAFRDTLGALQHFVPKWAHLSNYTSQQQGSSSSGASQQQPKAPASPSSPAQGSYASTGDLRVLCAMGGSVGGVGDIALREYFFTETANPLSAYAKHADDLLFVVVPPGPEEKNSSSGGSKSGGGDGSSSSESGVGGKVVGAFKSLFKKVSDKFATKEQAVVHTPQQLLSGAAPASSSSSPASAAAAAGSSSSSGISYSSSPVGSPASPSPTLVPNAPGSSGHPCADAADPVAAGETAVQGSIVTVMRRGIAPLQPVVQATADELAVLLGNNLRDAGDAFAASRKRNSFIGERDLGQDDLSSSSSSASSSASASPVNYNQQQQQLACLQHGVFMRLQLPREPNWFATLALNLVCQWPYFLNVAVVKMVRVKELSGGGTAPVPVAIRTVQRQVFPTLNPPRNLRTTLARGGGKDGGKDEGEDGNDGRLEYPDMHFTVDDFEDAFGDIRLAPGHKLAVLLTAGGPPAKCGGAVAVFRGVVNYESLVQQLMKQEKAMGKSLATLQQKSGGVAAAVVPLKAQSGRAEVAIWLTEADILVAHQRAEAAAAIAAAMVPTSGGAAGSAAPVKDRTLLNGTEVLHSALSRVSLHCSHVVSALLQNVPWHSLHASWLPKQSAAPSKTRWMIFPRDNVQLGTWMEEDAATCKAMGITP
jgi:hypothetical protein